MSRWSIYKVAERKITEWVLRQSADEDCDHYDSSHDNHERDTTTAKLPPANENDKSSNPVTFGILERARQRVLQGDVPVPAPIRRSLDTVVKLREEAASTYDKINHNRQKTNLTDQVALEKSRKGHLQWLEGWKSFQRAIKSRREGHNQAIRPDESTPQDSPPQKRYRSSSVRSASPTPSYRSAKSTISVYSLGNRFENLKTGEVTSSESEGEPLNRTQKKREAIRGWKQWLGHGRKRKETKPRKHRLGIDEKLESHLAGAWKNRHRRRREGKDRPDAKSPPASADDVGVPALEPGSYESSGDLPPLGADSDSETSSLPDLVNDTPSSGGSVESYYDSEESEIDWDVWGSQVAGDFMGVSYEDNQKMLFMSMWINDLDEMMGEIKLALKEYAEGTITLMQATEVVRYLILAAKALAESMEKTYKIHELDLLYGFTAGTGAFTDTASLWEGTENLYLFYLSGAIMDAVDEEGQTIIPLPPPSVVNPMAQKDYDEGFRVALDALLRTRKEIKDTDHRFLLEPITSIFLKFFGANYQHKIAASFVMESMVRCVMATNLGIPRLVRKSHLYGVMFADQVVTQLSMLMERKGEFLNSDDRKRHIPALIRSACLIKTTVSEPVALRTGFVATCLAHRLFDRSWQRINGQASHIVIFIHTYRALRASKRLDQEIPCLTWFIERFHSFLFPKREINGVNRSFVATLGDAIDMDVDASSAVGKYVDESAAELPRIKQGRMPALFKSAVSKLHKQVQCEGYPDVHKLDSTLEAVQYLKKISRRESYEVLLVNFWVFEAIMRQYAKFIGAKDATGDVSWQKLLGVGIECAANADDAACSQHPAEGIERAVSAFRELADDPAYSRWAFCDPF